MKQNSKIRTVTLDSQECSSSRCEQRDITSKFSKQKGQGKWGRESSSISKSSIPNRSKQNKTKQNQERAKEEEETRMEGRKKEKNEKENLSWSPVDAAAAAATCIGVLQGQDEKSRNRNP